MTIPDDIMMTARAVFKIGLEAVSDDEYVKIIATALLAAEQRGMERAAELIEQNIIQNTGDSGKRLAPRQSGNQDGLFYAAAIRKQALATLQQKDK